MLGKAEDRTRELNALYPVWENYTQWTWFAKSAARFRRETFLIVDDEEFSYEDILSLSRHLSTAFYAIGLRKGMVVALSMENRKEMPAISFALSRLGCVNILVNARLSDGEKEYILAKTRANFLISDQELRKKQCDAQIRCRIISGGIAWPDRAGQEEISLEELLRFGSQTKDEIIEEYERKIHDPSALSTIIFTSGSTGNPKGVMLTDDMLVRSAFATVNTRRMEIGRRIYLPVPCFHALGFVEGLLSAVAVGGSLVVYTSRCDTKRHLTNIRRWRVNDIVSVSTVITRILMDMKDEEYSFPDLHAIYYAGAFPEWVWEASKAFFDVTDCGTGYGMTECGSTSNIYWKPAGAANRSSSEKEDHAETGDIRVKHGQIKQAGIAAEPRNSNSILELKIEGEDRACRQGEEGEILVRGISVTKGYIHDPEETAAHFDRDGWFHTGDLGKISEDSSLIFIGRIGDQYKVNGENVSPKRVEEAILQMPGINYAEVVGIPHETCGQVGVAFVEVNDDTITAQEIDRFLRSRLAAFQRPKAIFFMKQEEWPRAGMSKVSKARLKEIAIERTDFTAK